METYPGLECFQVEGQDVAVIYVPLVFFAGGREVSELSELRASLKAGCGLKEVLFLYQDRWTGKGPLVRKMLEAHLGCRKTVFARNCEIREISQESAASFLEKNHLYGSLKSAFRYGLFRVRATGKHETGMEETGSLVAVGIFSEGREIGGRMSYEWLRYSSAGGCRVVGGMGKILERFIADLKSCTSGTFDVMSYADLEWSEGESYLKLGFEENGYRPPVQFLCDPVSGARIHEAKVGKDCKYRSFEREGKIPVCNLGSLRFIKVIQKS